MVTNTDFRGVSSTDGRITEMKIRWFVPPILVLGFVLFGRIVSPEHMETWGTVAMFIAVVFFIEQSERRIIERLDRIEALTRAKTRDDV